MMMNDGVLMGVSTWLRLRGVDRDQDLRGAVVGHRLQRAPRGHSGEASNQQPAEGSDGVSVMRTRASPTHH